MDMIRHLKHIETQNSLCRNALITETQTNPFRDKQHPRALTLRLA